ncbi:hypothetical protein J0J30_24100, partial [Vibrio vulnificus]|nr:hypothetical protein [Vibrio vulnificus]
LIHMTLEFFSPYSRLIKSFKGAALINNNNHDLRSHGNRGLAYVVNQLSTQTWCLEPKMGYLKNQKLENL